RDEERAHAAMALLEQDLVLLLEGFHAADPAAHEHTEALGVLYRQRESRGLERFVRGRDRELDEAIHPLRILAFDHALRREVLHLAGETRLERGCVEACDGCGSRLPVDEIPPRRLEIVPERRDHA